MAGSKPLRRLLVALGITGALAANLAPAQAATTGPGTWADVAPHFWAKPAIDAVAHRYPWMEDFGATHFKPNLFETRDQLAHAMVLAFAPHQPVDPSITFKDMAPTDPYYPFADVAVKNRWIPRIDGSFLPQAGVTMTDVHKALIRALGLWPMARAVDGIHTTSGYVFHHQKNLGALELGMLLGFRYNHDDDALDMHPNQRLPRSEVAWSLYQAWLVHTTESSKIGELQQDGFMNIHLGPISPAMRKVVEFGLRYVGYPYMYAGEWGSPTPASYCCGAQETGGFDCSGLTWWLMKAPEGGYDNTRIRHYHGWWLPQRSSMDMAVVGRKLSFKEARAGDLMLYSSDGKTIDHVDVSLGYGWALDSSNGVGGVTVLRISDGWYRDHFVHARRIIPETRKS